MEKITQYIDNNREKFIDEMKEFLKIPSISSLDEGKADVNKCALWLKEKFSDLGIETQIFETEGHPIVYAEKIVDSSKPTVLVYGHYDVQPVDPLDLWDTPPFEPRIEDGKIFARGSADDKGQVWIHYCALKTLLETQTELDINLKFLIEGEEEVGSPNLVKFLEANKELLKSDVLLVSDTAMIRKGVPTLTYGLRGLTYLTITVKSADSDAHSGEYGGAVHNGVNVMCELLSKLKDEKGKILIPGFYAKVASVPTSHRSTLSNLPFCESEFIGNIGASKTVGEEGYSTLERLWIRPTFDINGICGGFTEKDGAKTVIPKEVFAKISMRLVPDQNPIEITELTEKYLKAICPEGIELTVRDEHGGNPWVADIDKPIYKVVEKCLKDTFDREVAYVRCGGSIPIVDDFYRVLDVHCVLVGFSLPDAKIHAPNENFDLECFDLGMKSIVRIYKELGNLKF